MNAPVITVDPAFEHSFQLTASPSPIPKMGAWESPPTKPKRPLSAYNFFFQMEREQVLQSSPKVGFTSLARAIAKKWKTIDVESRIKVTMLAAQDRIRYQQEMGGYQDQVEEHQRHKERQLELNRQWEEAATVVSNDSIAHHLVVSSAAYVRPQADPGIAELAQALSPDEINWLITSFK
jgi:hypothetical protein